MKRELLVKITVEWEDYDDVCDELLLSDVLGEMCEGVTYEIVKE
jgi:hypothetical protein